VRTDGRKKASHDISPVHSVHLADIIKKNMFISSQSINWSYEWTNEKPSRYGRRYVVCDLELWPTKNSFCAFLARVNTYTHTKN